MGFKSFFFSLIYGPAFSWHNDAHMFSFQETANLPHFLTPHRCGGLVPLRVLSVMTAHLQGGFDGMLGMLEDQGGFMQLKRQGFEKQRLYDLTPSC